MHVPNLVSIPVVVNECNGDISTVAASSPSLTALSLNDRSHGKANSEEEDGFFSRPAESSLFTICDSRR